MLEGDTQPDPSLATMLLMARAANKAYDDFSSIESHYQKLGYAVTEIADTGTDTQGFTAYKNNILQIAMRGTEMSNINDWLTDFNVFPAKTSFGYVPSGFYKAFTSIYQSQVLPVAQGQGGLRKIEITGHSLGGALANLIALQLRQDIDPSVTLTTYTFAAPPCGYYDYYKQFGATVQNWQTSRFYSYQVTNYWDPVPWAGWLVGWLGAWRMSNPFWISVMKSPPLPPNVSYFMNHSMETVYLDYVESIQNGALTGLSDDEARAADPTGVDWSEYFDLGVTDPPPKQTLVAAIYQGKDKGFLFFNNFYYKWDFSRNTQDDDQAYPAALASEGDRWKNWGFSHDELDAAATDHAALTGYFFHGRHFITMDLTDFSLVQSKTDLTDLNGWPAEWSADPYVDAAFYSERENAMYVFRGSEYARYDFDYHRFSSGEWPKPINSSNWVGWPSTWDGLDAACYMGNHQAVMFRDGEYVLYDDTNDRITTAPAPVIGSDLFSKIFLDVQVPQLPSSITEK